MIYFFLLFFPIFLSASSLQEAIHYDLHERNQIGYIEIDGDRGIDQSTYLYVKFALEHYKQVGVRFILLHLNTPGGEIFSSMKIAQLLQKIDREDHIPVVAFIDHWAISAGAMLAYSSRFIGVSQTASMGAAEPVTGGADGQMESASEKINSALRSEFASLAQSYDRNPLIAEAMVDKDLILVWRQGQVVRLEQESEIKQSDEIISRAGKLLTLNAQGLIQYGIANFVVPPHGLAPITEEEREKGEWAADKSLLFQHPFFAAIPHATILSYQNWKIAFFSFLSHPLVSSLLFMGLLIGLYVEMSHPGFGIPGILSLMCLSLILLSSFSVETIYWLELIILAVGVVLLLVELLVLPGFGVCGVVGIILTIGGLLLLILPDIRSIPFSWDFEHLNLAAIDFLYRLKYASIALFLSVIVICVLAFFFSPRLLKWSRLVLKGEQEGYTAGPDVTELPVEGSCGVVYTPLRPGGKVLIAGKIYEAFSEGMLIDTDQPITVLRLEGNKLIVHPNNCKS